MSKRPNKITKEEFETRARQVKDDYENQVDRDLYPIELIRLMVEVLESLGYESGTKIFKQPFQ